MLDKRLRTIFSRRIALAVIMMLNLSPTYPPSDTGGPQLQFLGHASFRVISSEGRSVLIDPYGNSFWSRWFKKPLRRFGTPDVVVTTHAHFDHNALHLVDGEPERVARPTTIVLDDVRIQLLEGHHARSWRYGRENRIVRIDAGGVRIVHFGDNRAELSDELVAQLRPVDLLILPVDKSEHLLEFDEVGQVIDRLEPRVVIPCHYEQAGISSWLSPLGGIESWLETQPRPVRAIRPKGIAVGRADLPTPREVWVLEPLGIN